MTVTVSGGVSGIGEAIVREGIVRGWTMLGGSRRTGLDVRDEASIDRFVSARVDAAVACAAVSINTLFLDMSPGDLSTVLETNLDGSFLFARTAIRRGASGVLLIGSLNQLGAPTNALYATSKAALVGLMRAMTREYPCVRTNILVPGFVLTPMTQSLPCDVRERLSKASPLRRAVTASEVARCAVDLLASPLRGRVVRVTGGLLETPA